MRRIYCLLTFILSFWFIPGIAWAQTGLNPPPLDPEYLETFSSEITLNRDTSISILETLVYSTATEKHGIYRYLPERLLVNNFNLTTSISDIEVTGTEGNRIPFSKPYKSGVVTLKIGDPETTFSGSKTYRISYRVDDALKRFDGHDELYWDITGESWQFPIFSTAATIRSPHAEITGIVCYSGPVGSDNGLCQSELIDPHTAQITYPRPVRYGDNVTIAVALDQANSQIKFPGTLQRTLKVINDNIFLLIVLAPSVIMFYLWYTRGRDHMFISPNIFDNEPHKPQTLKPLFYGRIPMVYQPLHQLTPGEAGTILDERVDNQDVIAEILDLARKRYLKINPTQKQTLIFSSKDFEFEKLKPADDTLPAHQKYLQEQIFKSGDRVSLSSLKGTFYTAMAKAKDMISTSAQDKKLFTRHPATTRAIYFAIGFVMLVVAFFTAVSPFSSTPAAAILVLLQAPGVILLAYQMVQKSAIGTNYHLQAKGLQATIRRGAWRERIHEKNLFIEEVLPFSIALGVVDQLTRDMKDLNLKPPEYLSASYAGMRSFNTASFINSFSAQASSNLSYNPSSSSASGGSGFSGGSSGGGGGGGGGGSW